MSEVEMLRKMDRFAVGDRFRGPRAWCEGLIKLGWAKAIEEPVEPAKKRRYRRRADA